MKISKIFDDAKDKNVAAVVIYLGSDDKYYYDEDGTLEVASTDMFDLFIKGVVCVADDVYYKPTSCTEEGVITFPFPTEEDDSDGGPEDAGGGVG